MARAAFWRLVLTAVMVWTWALPASAHDVPLETEVRAFVKPEGDRLHVLLRLPLSLLLNVDLPKQGPGYLALAHVDEGLARAVAAADKDIVWFENGRRLALIASVARISLPSDRSFSDFGTARAHVIGPRLPDSAFVFWNQGYLDAHLEYRIESARPAIALDFRVAPALRDRLHLDLRYVLPDGQERAFNLRTAQGRVALDPRWYQAAWTFLESGFQHILEGPDHLLFLLCLILPFRRVDAHLVGVVTAFTVTHSITLISAVYGLAPAADWFVPAIETLIAASILYMAIENVLQPRLQRRWLMSAVFGLVHGFGFSFMLQSQLQFAGSNLVLSLLAFNVGVELGQLLVIVVVLSLLSLWRRAKPDSERAIAVIVCALAGHVAWHWTVERFDALRAAAPEDWASPGLLIGAIVLLAVLVWSGGGLRRLRQAARRTGPLSADT